MTDYNERLSESQRSGNHSRDYTTKLSEANKRW
jgi:hypothetical protein